jgi:hypothetical protein
LRTVMHDISIRPGVGPLRFGLGVQFGLGLTDATSKDGRAAG